MSNRRRFRAVPIEHARQFRKRPAPRKRQSQTRRTATWLGLAALVGSGVGYISTQGGASLRTAQQLLPSSSSVVSPKSWAYYANCNEARAAGAAPLYQGEPGYRSPLDTDGDGIACEPYRGSHLHRRRLRFHF